LQGILGPKDNGGSPNKEIRHIIEELDSIDEELKQDPFLLYLEGIGLRLQRNEEAAIKKLTQSVMLFPYNWSSWQELLCCIPTMEKLGMVLPLLPDHIMTRIFIIYSRQEFFQSDEETFGLLEKAQKSFPDFLFFNVQKALLCYHNLDYLDSENEFKNVLIKDPYRLDDMDIYSNILYVMERAPELAFLAQLANSTDKFRPETCCIIANYYSLKSQHEKAIVYYQRALVLDRNCLSAWTLMGHEFVELKNTHAAIESYRRAVDASKRDYRAWYGLGQAYEVLEMHYYSLYYYQRALALKPLDVRMWLALGNCFDKLDRIDESIKAYKRAVRVSAMDPIILLKIATLYEKNKESENAATYMKLCLTDEQPDYPSESQCHARLWLAKYELKRGRWVEAHDYAYGVTRGTGAEIEEARAIMRDAKSRRHAGGTAGE
jgi:anaphase-promoting complex subunit 8